MSRVGAVDHRQDMADQAYFRRLSNRIAERPPAGNASSASSSANTPKRNGASGLMTQVQQTPSPSSSKPRQRGSSVGRRSGSQPPTGQSDTEYRNRLRRIQQQAKNLSPMNPAKYAPLLLRAMPSVAGRKCLVLDVDETLVHSTYKPTQRYDLHLPCEVNGGICNIYVSYRPHLMEFLEFAKELFEVVIFTASVDIYCNPLMDKVDPDGRLGAQRLFRDHCSSVNGSYVKDLTLLGRQLDQICIIDNSPVAYLFQPRNAIPIISWFDDPDDTELIDLFPTLRALAEATDVYEVLDEYNARLQPGARDR
jgi:Dullard-like phosphatase family protein